MTEKLRTLLKDTSIYGLGSIIGRALSIFFVPIYTRLLTPADYGILDVFGTISNLLGLILILGLDGATAYYYYQTSEVDKRNVIISTSFYFRLILSSIVCAFIVINIPFLNQHFVSGYSSYFLYVVILTIPFRLSVMFYQTLFRVKRSVWQFVTLALANTLLVVLLNVILVIVLRLEVAGILTANAIANLILAIFGFLYLKQDLRFHFSKDYLKPLLRYGLPLVPASISYWVLAYVDRYFLVIYTDLATVGIYSISNKLSGLLTFFTGAFQMAWPAFAFSIQHDDNAKDIYAKVFTLYTVGMSLLTVILSLFGKEVLLIVAPIDYLPAFQAVGILGLSIVVTGQFNILGIGISLSGKTEHIGWITALAALFNVMLNFLLIPTLGFMGAAVTTLLSFSLSSVILFTLAQRNYYIPYEVHKVLRVFLLAVAIILLGLFIDRNSEISIIYQIIGKMSLLISFTFLLWILKIVVTEEITIGWCFVRKRLFGLGF